MTKDQIKARFEVLENAHNKVVAALGNDDPRATELLGMVRALLCETDWSSEAPNKGRWRVSIRPELRRGFPATVECEVWEGSIEAIKQWVVQYRPGGDLLPLKQDWFAGTKWQRIPEVDDPFR